MADRGTSRAALAIAAALAAIAVAIATGRSEAPRDRVLRIARAELGSTDWRRYTQGTIAQLGPNDRPAWCGLFALWVYHQAGLGRAHLWTIGEGFASLLPRTNDPQPGDLVYYDRPYQHHAIVEEVGPDFIVQIQGNGAGGAVTRSRVARSSTQAFYSLAPWLTD